MKIHEYQARQILSEAGVPVPPAEVVRTPDEAAAAFKHFAAPMCVVKAQVYAGGRGKAGGDWRYADILTVLAAACDLIRPRSYLEIGVRRGRSMAMVAS